MSLLRVTFGCCEMNYLNHRELKTLGNSRLSVYSLSDGSKVLYVVEFFPTGGMLTLFSYNGCNRCEFNIFALTL